jgi:hypothetical protein
VFLVATVTAVAAGELVPDISRADYLVEAVDHSHRLATAALFYLIAAGTSVWIAIVLYPFLRTANATLALGAVVFRTIEAVFYTVAVVCLLSVLGLGRRLATAPVGDRAAIRAVADTLVGVREQASLAGVIAFGTGALMYYGLFYRHRLLPRWLSGWGMAGVILILIACLLALFSGDPVTGYTLLILPIGIQEVVLALWLLIKGFTRVAAPAETRPAAE